MPQALPIVAGSRVADSTGRLSRFDAVITASATLDSGHEGPRCCAQRGGRNDITIRAIYTFTAFNAVSIKSTTPEPRDAAGNVAILGGNRHTFDAVVTFAVNTEPVAELVLELSDSDSLDAPLASTRRPVQGTGETPMSLGDLLTPGSARRLSLRARLVTSDGRTIGQSQFVDFPVAVDLEVERVEVVQVVQNEAHDIRLVANKPAAVRVFLKMNAADPDKPPRSVAGATAVLRAEGKAGDLYPDNFFITVTHGESLDSRRTRDDGSLNFRLPRDWTGEGTLQLTAEIRPSVTYEEGNPANNALSRTVQFQVLPNWERPLRIRHLRTCSEAEQPGRYRCPPSHVGDAGFLLKKLLPAAPADIDYAPEYLDDLRGGTDVGTYLELLGVLRWSLYQANPAANPLPDHLVFWSGGESEGSRFLPRRTASAVEVTPDTPLPAAAGYLADAFAKARFGSNDCLGTIALQPIGFDPETLRGTYAAGTCRGMNWLTADVYSRLMDTPPFLPPAKRAGTASQARQADENLAQTLLIAGRVRPEGPAGRLLPVFRLPIAPPLEEETNGEYCVRLSQGDTVLATRCFTVAPGDSEESGFSLSMGAPAGVTRVSLFRGEVELSSIRASEAAPQISISTPAAGEIWEGTRTISWTASDADSDPLSFAILYSPDDGASWLPLLAGSRAMEYSFDTGRIIGGKQVRFRVLASDGFNQSEATSGTIEIVQQPRISAAAEPVDSLNVMLGRSAERILAVRNTGAGQLMVKASLDQPAFGLAPPGAERTIPAGGVAEFTVVFTPAGAGPFSARLKLESNDAAAPVMEIPVTGAGSARYTPEMVLAAASIDFGNTLAGSVRDAGIRVFNRGPAPLNIRSLASRPETFETAILPFSLEPGSTGTIPLRFRPSLIGSVTGTLDIVSDDPARPRVFVTLRGRGVTSEGPAITLDVAAVNFGSVSLGAVRGASILIGNLGGGADLVVRSVRSSNPVFSSTAPAPFTVPAESILGLGLSYSPAAAGNHSGTLELVTNDPVRPRIEIPLSGTGVTQGVPKIESAVSRLDFGQVATGKTKDLVLIIRNTGSATLQLTRYTTSNPQFSVNVPVDSVFDGNFGRALIRYTPMSAGAHSATLSIASNDPATPVAVIALTGTGAAP